MSDEKRSFEYTYSAKEQAEIKKIRDRYASPQKEEPDKMEQLRRLDEGVTQKGSVSALILGVVGALILGLGMSFVMSDLGRVFNSSGLALIVGCAIGLVGLVLVCMAYPVYNYITKRERERIAPEIIRLTDELLK